MKHFLVIAVIATTFITLPALAANAGVSVSIGQPGFYGRLDIGDFPPPQVIYSQPRAVYRVPMNRPPIYLHVPPGHAKNWKKHCREYNACNERVYFVQDNWYNREYVPRYREQHRDRRDEKGDGRRNERGDDHRGGGNNRDHGRNR